MNRIVTGGLALALLAFSATAAFASEEEFDIDTRFRAKIVKEKVRAAALERKLQAMEKQGLDGAACGSQNIGNIDTGGRPGTAPREVFVFAPNAINIVSGRGCN